MLMLKEHNLFSYQSVSHRRVRNPSTIDIIIYLF